jgi:hypothetical protein
MLQHFVSSILNFAFKFNNGNFNASTIVEVGENTKPKNLNQYLKSCIHRYFNIQLFTPSKKV